MGSRRKVRSPIVFRGTRSRSLQNHYQERACAQSSPYMRIDRIGGSIPRTGSLA